MAEVVVAGLVAEAAIGFLVDKLTEILNDNSELVADARDQVKGLLMDLRLFKGFIEDLTGKGNNNNTVKALVDNMKSVVDDAEDIIDSFVVEQANFKKKRLHGKIFYGIPHNLRIKNIAEEIESVRKKVNDMYAQRNFAGEGVQRQLAQVDQEHDHDQEDRINMYRVHNNSNSMDQQEEDDDEVVGFDDDASSVIQHLIRKDKLRLDIITIAGVGGLGKTTLARKIYNDPTIASNFVTRTWVSVSQNYTTKGVCLSILKGILSPQSTTITTTTTTTKKKYSSHEEEEDRALLNKVRECLRLSGKYLIVMDDVCTGKAWIDLKDAFPDDNNNGSRILITSRHTNLAGYTSSSKASHNLEFLSPDKSWELLRKKVFFVCGGGDGSGDADSNIHDNATLLETLGREIATGCRGLPLSIRVVAGILLNNRDSAEWWKQVRDKVNKSLLDADNQADLLVELSYNYLPYHLKSCFLYLGIFPEGYEIPVWKLILLWVAEGFIAKSSSSGGGKSLEEIAKGLIDQLADRNLLMVAKRRPNGHIKTCYVHNIVHRFCKQEALNHKLQVVEDDATTGVSAQEYRRICIHSGVPLEYVSLKPSGKRVRSFLCIPPGGGSGENVSTTTTLPKDPVSAITKAFRYLRVLEIRSVTFKNFPDHLLQLALLRYIAISCNINVLPSTISTLWHMQTMIFVTTSPTLDLKKVLWKMHQLRHLYTNASAVLPPPPSDKPNLKKTSLQSLSTISPESCNQIARTPNVTKLGIRGNIAILFRDLFQTIGDLQKLTNLKLFNEDFHGLATAAAAAGNRVTLPLVHQFPTKLQKLTLSGTLLGWEQMEILGDLEKLEELKLKENAFHGKVWTVSNGGFKTLKLLHIGKTNLETWTASETSFPKLTRLLLRDCESLKEAPFQSLANVPSFKELKLHCTNKAVVDSARHVYEARAQQGFKLHVYPPDL